MISNVLKLGMAVLAAAWCVCVVAKRQGNSYLQGSDGVLGARR